ncbi:MAG: dihydropteroate synthase [Bacteroidales bacterium]
MELLKNKEFLALKIEFKKRALDLSVPKVMGIINLTPDSFYDGRKRLKKIGYLNEVEKMISEGADIIDLGAVSTRPGSTQVSEEEELGRLLGPLQKIISNFPEILISIDTYRSKVARAVIEAGAHMINDISGGTFDEEIFDVISEFKIPYILMHIQGTPQTMQNNPIYTDVVAEVKLFFETKLKRLKDIGADSNIILDPGFGFGKTTKHNYQLLHGLKHFAILGRPLLVGVSRKSMINKVLKTSPGHALNGTTVIHTLALLNGANILRVHDVNEAKEAIHLVAKYNDELR